MKMKYQLPEPVLRASSREEYRTGINEPLYNAAQMQAAYQSGRDSMAEEVEAVRRANLDCMDYFNALKADYDEIRAKRGVL